MYNNLKVKTEKYHLCITHLYSKSYVIYKKLIPIYTDVYRNGRCLSSHPYLNLRYVWVKEYE